MNTPDRITASAFNHYLSGEVLADSAVLGWTGLYVRLCRMPRVVDSFFVPATPEPLNTCNAKGSAEFRERAVGGAWITRKLEPGAMFVTHSKTPYEVRWTSPAGRKSKSFRSISRSMSSGPRSRRPIPAKPTPSK